MTKKDRMIRVPVELASRLDRLVAQFQESHIAGRLRLPNEYCQECPKHYVISVALDLLEDHRARSRWPRQAKRSDALPTKSPRLGKGVYT
jgi:hypothetical protein